MKLKKRDKPLRTIDEIFEMNGITIPIEENNAEQNFYEVSKMRELVFDPAKIDLANSKVDEAVAKEVDLKDYDKWKEFGSYIYQLHEMRNEGCRGCEEPPTTCRKCMQDYYWLNIKHYL